MDFTSDQLQIVLGLAGDFYQPKRDDRPENLCHYTGARGLLGILKSGQMRLGHGRFLNDPEEIVYGSRVQKTFFAKLPKVPRKSQKFSEACRIRAVSDSSLQEVLDLYYCASFSESIDDLAQFRLYADGGAGFCLVFDAEELDDCFTPHGAKFGDFCPLDLIKITYDRDEQLRQMQILYTKSETLFLEGGGTDEKLKELADAWKFGCDVLSMSYKQPGFRGEAEWRFAVSAVALWQKQLETKIDPQVDIDYRTGGLTTHLLPAIGCRGLSGCLRQIIIGPKAEYQNTCHSVEVLLKTYLPEGISDKVAVVPSTSSLR